MNGWNILDVLSFVVDEELRQDSIMLRMTSPRFNLHFKMLVGPSTPRVGVELIED